MAAGAADAASVVATVSPATVAVSAAAASSSAIVGLGRPRRLRWLVRVHGVLAVQGFGEAGDVGVCVGGAEIVGQVHAVAIGHGSLGEAGGGAGGCRSDLDCRGGEPGFGEGDVRYAPGAVVGVPGVVELRGDVGAAVGQP